MQLLSGSFVGVMGRVDFDSKGNNRLGWIGWNLQVTKLASIRAHFLGRAGLSKYYIPYDCAAFWQLLRRPFKMVWTIYSHRSMLHPRRLDQCSTLAASINAPPSPPRSMLHPRHLDQSPPCAEEIRSWMLWMLHSDLI